MKPVRVFKAYQEDWEKAILHKYEYKYECQLLAKYAGLRYIWPEDEPYAATISSDCLCFVQKPKKDNPKEKIHWGWCLVLVPKGWEYNKDSIEKYEHLLLDSKEDDIYLLISATEQEDGVICIDKNKTPIIPQKVFEETFSMPYKKYDDFPQAPSINCNPSK